MGTLQYLSHVVLEEIGELCCSIWSSFLFSQSLLVYMKQCKLPETSEEQRHFQAPTEIFLDKDERTRLEDQQYCYRRKKSQAFGEESGDLTSSYNVTETYIANCQLQLSLTRLHATCLSLPFVWVSKYCVQANASEFAASL